MYVSIYRNIVRYAHLMFIKGEILMSPQLQRESTLLPLYKADTAPKPSGELMF